MNTFKSKLQYLIDLTEAYKNEHITKEEYKEIRAFELTFIILYMSENCKDFISLMEHGFAFKSAVNQVKLILMQPKPPKNLKSGCAIAGKINTENEIVLTPGGNKIKTTTPNLQELKLIKPPNFQKP